MTREKKDDKKITQNSKVYVFLDFFTFLFHSVTGWLMDVVDLADGLSARTVLAGLATNIVCSSLVFGLAFKDQTSSIDAAIVIKTLHVLAIVVVVAAGVRAFEKLPTLFRSVDADVFGVRGKPSDGYLFLLFIKALCLKH